jgi:predicted NAD/FAD-dependent oxidoreductase
MQPCFALMIGFKEELPSDWIFAKVHNNPIKLIAVNSTKPGRNHQNSCFVVHSRSSWAQENLDRDPQEVQKILLKNFSDITGISSLGGDCISLHRWFYALIENSAENKTPFVDLDLGLAATSDWASNSRIEDVWLSSMLLLRTLAKLYG